MEEYLKVVGKTKQQLLKTIDLALELIKGTGDKTVTRWGISDDKKTLYFGSANYQIKCTTELPYNCNASIITDISWEWLKQFKPTYIGDGDSVNGYTVETEPFAQGFEISIKFSTIYYGK